MQRKLCAIMFTDMVGYTKLMGENEQLAKNLRRRHRDILESTVRDFGGQIIQFYGDGSLITFDSVLQAVQAAKVIQRAMMIEPQIPLRIGIHLGDIVFEEDGVYGEGVNVASRVESLGIAQSILISEKVYTTIQSHPEISAMQVGVFDLKNVKDPMKIFAIVGPQLKIPKPDQIRGKGELSVKTIAVLPFSNMSADPDNEFFSDGITEEILNMLVRVEELRVTSRTSSFAYKGKSEDIKEIAKTLGVQTILEGSVRRFGNRVRITAQLINAIEDVHLWSETYDRQMEDIFSLQEEIATKISNRMRLYLDEPGRISVIAPTRNMEAYDLYLKGIFFFNKFNPVDGFKAISYFDQAIALEPNFVLPLSHKAAVIAFLGSIGVVAPSEAFKRATEASDKVISSNPSEASAHVAKALVALFYEWNWKKVEYHLSCATDWRNNLIYLICKSLYLSSIGRSTEASAIIASALELDPLNPLLRFYYGQGLLYEGKLDEALYQYDRALILAPDLRTAIEAKGTLYRLKGEYETSLHYLMEYQAQIGNPLLGWTPMAITYGAMNRRDKVLEILNKTQERQRQEPDSLMHFDFAAVYLALGDHHQALTYLEDAYVHRLGSLVFLGIHHSWFPLHANPRFQRLLQKLGLPLATP